MASAVASKFKMQKVQRKRKLEKAPETISDESDLESEASEEALESEEDVEETPEEKRLRLAQIYLEELQRKEEESNSHNEINAKLTQNELEANAKVVKSVADKFASFGTITCHKDKVHKLPLTALAVSGSNYFFTASKDGSIVKWIIDQDQAPKWSIRKKNGGKNDDTKGHKSIINAMAVNADNTYLATGDDDKLIYIWKTSDLTFVKVFQGHRGAITGLAFARNKNVLYSCSRDRSVKTWDLDQMGYVETLFGHQDIVSCITSGISCDFLTGGGKDGTVRLWKTTDEVQLVFNHAQGASIEALDKINAELFVTVGDNGQISLWSTRKKTPLCNKQNAHGTDESNGCSRWISSLAILTCSDLIATGSSDGFIRLWKVDGKSKSIENLAEIQVQGFVNDMKFTANGQYLLAAVGQEHRLGRWWRCSEAKNHLMCIEIKYKD